MQLTALEKELHEGHVSHIKKLIQEKMDEIK